MFYHASSVKNIQVLEPRISNHNKPFIYFSDKRENVLVYLSNAVEKFCKENDFLYEGNWYKWGPYGFDKEGKLRFEEYYPNALEETYKDVSGYIYYVPFIEKKDDFELNIPNAFVSDKSMQVSGYEYVEDAYEELIKAEKEGLITIVRYEEFIAKRADWLKRVIKEEYKQSEDHPEYRYFLKAKFNWILEEK